MVRLSGSGRIVTNTTTIHGNWDGKKNPTVVDGFGSFGRDAQALRVVLGKERFEADERWEATGEDEFTVPKTNSQRPLKIHSRKLTWIPKMMVWKR